MPTSSRGWLRALGVTIVTMLASRRAIAAPDEGRSSESIYLEGRAAFDRGEYDKACPAFLEYYEAERTPAALFTLAECEARWGKPARALAHFETFVRLTADAPPSPVQEQRARMAYEHIAKLSALVGKVLPVVSRDVRGPAVIKLDGAAIEMPVSHPIVVEPGAHTLELDTDDGRRIEKQVVVAAGESRRIELGSSEPPPPESAAPSERREIGTPVIVATGVAGVGVVVGSIFGALAWGQTSTIHAHCADRLCDGEGRTSVDRAQGFATVSTIGFAVGIVAAATAVVLYLAAPRSGSWVAR